jgi:hypothetical protein
VTTITAQLFNGSGWSDPVPCEEINSRNVLHDGKLYSYLFHNRQGQHKRAPVASNRRPMAKKRHTARLQGDNMAKTGLTKGKRCKRLKTRLSDESPIVAAHSRCQKCRGPDGWIAGPYLDSEKEMARRVPGKLVKHQGKWWVVK